MKNQKLLVALEDDLFFVGKIDNAANQVGYRMEVAQTASGLDRKVKESHPDLVILDLTTEDIDLKETVQGLKRASPGTPILAFGPHADEALLAKASEAGCDAVVTKAVFSRELPDLIRRYGGDAVQ